VFVSGDSGDWLASARLWFVPQPYGSPLYISLAHLVGLIPGNLELNMVMWLSVLPAAISVAVIYWTIYKLKSDTQLALIGAGIMLAAGVFLTQATVIEEYSIAVMFFTLAVASRTMAKQGFVVLFLALASAIHIMAVLLTIVWVIYEIKDWRIWLKWSWVYILFGLAPYGLILYLMGNSQYPWLANGLTWNTINSYLGSSGTAFSLSMHEAPKRALQLVCITLSTYGVALVPAFKVFKKHGLFALLIIFLFWFYLTDLDYTTWTFTIYAVPLITLLAVYGLAESTSIRRVAVAINIVVLITLNTFFLNAATLNNEKPLARQFYYDTMNLPDGAVVCTSRGGTYTLGMFYVVSQGKDLTFNFVTEEKGVGDYSHETWADWADANGLPGAYSIDKSVNALAAGKEVFRASYPMPELGAERYITEYYNKNYVKVVSIAQ